MSQPLHRHIDACNNTPSLGHLLPFHFGTQQVGWISAELARALTFHPRDFHFEGRGVAMAGRLRSAGQRSDALAAVLPDLAKQGFGRVRKELFDVRAEPDGPALGTLNRGAIPAFGVIGQGVHLNGLVRRADGLHVWVGVRAKDKAVAPGQLDNLVAGGIPAGLDAEQTLVKEAEEEASLPAELAMQARRAGRLSYMMSNDEGLRRDVLHVYDLELPESFTPKPNDDEVERFELWPAARLLEAVRETEDVKFNVNLVLIDLFLREGLIDPEGAEGKALRAGLNLGP
ncbi:MAG: hydrolase [Rubritepida sp.]|nr:hydrolase [Rubritepida sp.]